MLSSTFVEITIGRYVLRPHSAPDDKVMVEVMRVDGTDAHDHSYGPERTIVVDDLFGKEKETIIVCGNCSAVFNRLIDCEVCGQNAWTTSIPL